MTGDLQHVHSGKVRDLYALPDGRLLMVASDRISAFDHVLDTEIPDKGEILTRMSLWWFDQLGRPGAPPRGVDRRARGVPRPGRGVRAAGHVPGRVRRPRLPHRLRAARLRAHRRGLRDRAPVRPHRRRPAARTDLHAGHQGRPRRPRRERLVRRGGRRPSARTSPPSCAGSRSRSTARAEGIARERGIILADTKLEFGRRDDGTLVLADEVLTPDSSRFWPADRVAAGPASQPSYDKQIVRNWLLSPGVRLGPSTPASRRRRCRPRSSTAPAAATSRPTSS